MKMENEKFLRTITIDESKEKNFTAISLFTGAGGAALGVREAGFEVRVMVEWEKAACDTLRANWTKKGWGKKKLPFWFQDREPAILQCDITKLSTKELLKAADLEVGEADLLEGGFPCQGFSTANIKRMIDDPRNSLYKECVRVIKEALPKGFFLENVRGLVNMAQGKIIDQICRDLADCGYYVYWDLLDAADYGVPQRRVRVIIFGQRIDVMRFPDGKNPALHIGCAPGGYNHPTWFEKKYKIYSHRSPWDVQ